MPKFSFKYSTITLFCLGMIALGIFYKTTQFSSVIGTLGLFGFFYYGGKILSHIPVFRKIPWSHTWAAIILLCFLIISHTLVYVVYKSTPISIISTFGFIAILLIASAIIFPGRDSPNYRASAFGELQKRITPSRENNLSIFVFLLQALLLFIIISKANSGVLPSPWIVFGYKFFILYGLTVFFLLLHQYRSRSIVGPLILSFLHFLITFGIVAIIYKIGYGYDPFLHRASEVHIFEYGSVEPKTPFYIGQYVLVNILAHVTNISIKAIDIWLVPILSIILLPISAYTGLRHGWRMPSRWVWFVVVLIPLYPLNTMFVTTPHNLANLFTLLTVFLSLLFIRKKSAMLPVLILAITASIIHPLSGVFALLFAIGCLFYLGKETWLPKIKYTKILLSGMYGLAVSVITPVLLLVYFYIQNIKPKPISAIWDNFSNFLGLFKEPYYFLHNKVHFFWDAVYIYRWVLPVILILLAVFAYYKNQNKKYLLFLSFPLFILVNVLLISTWVNFPDLDKNQQIQYAERLMHITLYFVLPLSLYSVMLIGKWIIKRHKLLPFAYIAILSAMLTTSLYLTYPQRNPKVYFRGFNVTGADSLLAYTLKEENENNEDYIVLSNILAAAASIEKYGFTTYFETPEGLVYHYSIPSGGPLYQRYLKMIYEDQKRETMEEAMDLTGVEKSYFVLHDYWDNAEKIAEGAKQTADRWQVIENGIKIWVFEYNKNPVEKKLDE